MWVIVGYIVFEMQSIRNKIESDTVEDFQGRNKRKKVAIVLFTGIFTVMYLPTSIVSYLYHNQLFKDNYNLLEIIIGIRCVSLLVCSIYFFPNFIRNMKFFVNYKKDSQKD